MIDGLPGNRDPRDDGDVPRQAKPCARRLRTPDGAVAWCTQPADHRDPTSPNYNPDCAGVTPRELPPAFADIGPKRQPRWGR